MQRRASWFSIALEYAVTRDAVGPRNLSQSVQNDARWWYTPCLIFMPSDIITGSSALSTALSTAVRRSQIMAMQAAGRTPKAISLLRTCQNSHLKCKVALGHGADWICAFGRTMAPSSFITLIELSVIPFHRPSQLQRSSRVSRGTGVRFINMETFCKHCISIPLCRLVEYKD